jgi:hypothetical protein
VSKLKIFTVTFGQSTYRRGPSEARGSEAADRAKGLVPTANVWFYCRPTNSLSILFTVSYERHAAFKTKGPWVVALLTLKPHLSFTEMW